MSNTNTPNKDSFDNLFKEMTNAMDYTNFSKTQLWEMEKELKKLDKNVAKASEITWMFNDTFSTEEAKKLGQSAPINSNNNKKIKEKNEKTWKMKG